MKLTKFLRLDFLPFGPDCGLLALRCWTGLSLLSLHGWGKLTKFNSVAEHFPAVFGLNSTMSLALAVFAEVFCSVLLVLGLFTRLAALMIIITLTTAFCVVHHGKLKGAGNGELAFIYLAGFVAIFLAGGGRFSLDAKMGGKT